MTVDIQLGIIAVLYLLYAVLNVVGIALEILLEIRQIVGLEFRQHGFHHLCGDVVGVYPVGVALLGVVLPDVHHRCHQTGVIHGFMLYRHRERSQRGTLNAVDISLHAIGKRQDQRNADDTDTSGEGGEEGASLFRHEVIL